MSFNYQPQSVNGVVSAVNGSVMAATNLLKMQELIDESRNIRQEKLHQQMLLKQTKQENFSKYRMQMEPRNSAYYEDAAGVEDEDERFKVMWDNVNTEHGNNRDMYAVLDKYKGGLSDKQGYSRFKKDLDIALTRASMNAENEASGHKYVKYVTDPATGEKRHKEMFNIEKYLAKQRGLMIPANKEYINYMRAANEKAGEYLDATGDKTTARFKEAGITANNALDKAKYSEGGSKHSAGAGGSIGVGAGGGVVMTGAPSSAQLKTFSAPVGGSLDLMATGATETDKRTGKGVSTLHSINVPATDVHNAIIQGGGGKAKILGLISKKKLSDDTYDLIKEKIGNKSGTPFEIDLATNKRENIDPEDLGTALTNFLHNTNDVKFVEQLQNEIGNQSLSPEDAGYETQTSGGKGGTPTSNSWNNSGIQDKVARRDLTAAGLEIIDVLDQQMKIAKNSDKDLEDSVVYGSHQARQLKMILSKLISEREDVPTEDRTRLQSSVELDYSMLFPQETDTPLDVATFGNRF